MCSCSLVIIHEYHIFVLPISHVISLKLHRELLILTTPNDHLFTEKKTIMKFAIPTNDGINVAPDFESAKGCLVVTLVLNDIVHEDLRWRSDQPGSGTGLLCSAVADCSLVIVRKITSEGKNMFREKNITLIQTGEEIITNAIVHYLEHEYREAANTCCCP
jgi:predicted Fe-Mo cluster-binding NifX family protein